MTFSLYLTGVPAVGKSSLARAIERRAGAARFSYGEILTEALAERVGSQQELREKSARLVSPADVHSVDAFIREALERLRGRQNTVVDSHALTAESYGLRAVPYGRSELRHLRYTHIVCLTATDEVIRDRLASAARGRRLQDPLDMLLHQSLQASLALGYASALGIPAAFIRADRGPETVLRDALAFVGHDE